MIRGARASALSIAVHGVDDTGALCKARPVGKWRPVRRLPINCPRCLYVMGKPRFAFCETPTGGPSLLHIRRVGPEGVSDGASGVGLPALCGAVAGWDRGEIDAERVTGEGVCGSCRRLLARG